MAKRLQVLLYNVDYLKLDTINIEKSIEPVSTSLTFPINPENITDSYERVVRTANILDNDEIYKIGEIKAKKFTINCILPEKDFILSDLTYLFPTWNYKPYTQESAKNLLNSWWKNQALLRFIVSDDINILCHISNYSLKYFENTSDLSCSIELIEDLNPTYQTESSKKDNGNLGFPKLKKRIKSLAIDNLNNKALKFVAQKGQTIYKIAKLYYGGNFMELAKLNGLENALNKDISGMVINFGLNTLDNLTSNQEPENN